MPVRQLACFTMAVFLATPAFANSPEDLIARGHYQRGEAAYEEGRYEAALHEFQAAHAAEALPAFDYNIARCLDRLTRRTDAVTAYERYLTTSPTAENAAEVRQRVNILRHELVESPPQTASNPHSTIAVAPSSSPAPKRERRWIVPGVLGGGAVALAAIGAGLLGSAASDYRALDKSCAPTCDTSSWAGLPPREYAGEALLGIAAAVAAVDVFLWVREARRR